MKENSFKSHVSRICKNDAGQSNALSSVPLEVFSESRSKEYNC